MSSDQPQLTAEMAASMKALLHQLVAAVDDLRSRFDATRKQLYTVDEVARLTARSAYTVRRWIAAGRLQAIRVDGTGPRGRLLIPGDQVARLLPQGLGGALPAVLASEPAGEGFK